MSVLLYSHPACADHDAGPYHPERPARLTAALLGARSSGVEIIEREAPQIDVAALSPVHDESYVESIRQFCAGGGGRLDADTFAVTASWEAALRAAGAGTAAIDALRAGEADEAFLAVRPPGHHALTSEAMGFCLFNNVAVATEYATASGDKVAIVDWDVHHGNGTQDTFYQRDDVLYVSFHEWPFYPGTGGLGEVGGSGAAGSTINVPFPAGTAGDAYRAVFDRVVMPVLDQFGPDWVFVSAGYDAHVDDPLASICLEHGDYGWMAGQISEVAPAQRTIYFLEGGYDLDAIEASVAATLSRAAGEGTRRSPRAAFSVIDQVAAAHSGRWEVG